MRTARTLRQGLVWMALVGMCLPVPMAAAGIADTPAAPAAEVSAATYDIELAQDGLLTGRLVDAEMRPLAAADVAISTNGRVVANTVTDDRGVFAVAGLRSGFHQIAAGDAVRNCRFWAVGTAPPRATQGMQIVADDSVVRGQWGPPTMTNRFIRNAKVWATNPFVVGGIVAAAVAIPVALNNDDEGPSS